MRSPPRATRTRKVKKKKGRRQQQTTTDMGTQKACVTYQIQRGETSTGSRYVFGSSAGRTSYLAKFGSFLVRTGGVWMTSIVAQSTVKWRSREWSQQQKRKNVWYPCPYHHAPRTPTTCPHGVVRAIAQGAHAHNVHGSATVAPQCGQPPSLRTWLIPILAGRLTTIASETRVYPPDCREDFEVRTATNANIIVILIRVRGARATVRSQIARRYVYMNPSGF